MRTILYSLRLQHSRVGGAGGFVTCLGCVVACVGYSISVKCRPVTILRMHLARRRRSQANVSLFVSQTRGATTILARLIAILLIRASCGLSV